MLSAASCGPAPGLLGVAAVARGQRTLEHARGPQRVEGRSVGSGVGVIPMLCMHHRGTSEVRTLTFCIQRGGPKLGVCAGQAMIQCQ